MSHRPRWGRARRRASARLSWFLDRAQPRAKGWLARAAAEIGTSADLHPSEQLAAVGRHYRFLREHEEHHADRIGFSILVAPDGRPEVDSDLIGSVAVQLLPATELVMVADADGPEPVGPPGDRATPIRSVPSGATPRDTWTALTRSCTADRVVVLARGDRLYPDALSELARAIRQARADAGSGAAADVLYGDDALLTDGRLQWPPRLKPRWSPLLEYGTDYVGPFAVSRQSLSAAAARITTGTRQDALLSSITDITPLHVPATLTMGPRPRSGADTIRADCERRGTPAAISRDPDGTLDVRFEVAADPTVSIVIPTRNELAVLRRCVESVLRRSTFQAIELVIVDNGSTDPAVRRWYRSLPDDMGPGRSVRILDDRDYFNFARLCNRGVAASSGDYVVLLNNDTEVISPGWIEAMLAVAVHPQVGPVGAQLRYPDGSLQHAGIVGLAAAGTGHAFVAKAPDHEDPLRSVSTTREVLAVTGACLMLARRDWDRLGGLDADLVPNAGGDVDLCLRARRAGLVSVLQPHAVLRHHESLSRGRGVEDFERIRLQRTHPDEILNDPYLNPRLTRSVHPIPDGDSPGPVVPLETLRTWWRQGRIPGLD